MNVIGEDKNILEFERELETKDIDFKAKKERFVDTEILMFDVEPVEVYGSQGPDDSYYVCASWYIHGVLFILFIK